MVRLLYVAEEAWKQRRGVHAKRTVLLPLCWAQKTTWSTCACKRRSFSPQHYKALLTPQIIPPPPTYVRMVAACYDAAILLWIYGGVACRCRTTTTLKNFALANRSEPGILGICFIHPVNLIPCCWREPCHLVKCCLCVRKQNAGSALKELPAGRPRPQACSNPWQPVGALPLRVEHSLTRDGVWTLLNRDGVWTLLDTGWALLDSGRCLNRTVNKNSARYEWRKQRNVGSHSGIYPLLIKSMLLFFTLAPL